MDSSIDWQRVYQALSQLLDISEPNRKAKLEELCGEDEKLKEVIRTALSEADVPSTQIGFEQPVQQMMENMVSESQATPPSRSAKKIKQYYIQRIIGHGGQGDVYRAWDEQLERTVALKFLSHRHPLSEQAFEQFQREARAIAAVEHPHICRLYSLESTDEGVPFMVMEFVDGISLAEKLKRDGPLSPNQATDLVRQICQGLKAAHAQYLIHRDIKPSNILLAGPEEKVKIADFGIAKWSRLHSQDGEAGTLPYMSPEQLKGEDTDYRTDIWSLGVLLYEVLAGKNPLSKSGLTRSSCSEIVHNETPFPRLTGMPSNVEKMLGGCLKTDREERFRSIVEVESHLLEEESETESGIPRHLLAVMALAASFFLLTFLFIARFLGPEGQNDSIAIVWANQEDAPEVREWVNFHLESALSRLPYDSVDAIPRISIVAPAKEVSTPLRVFQQYDADRVVALSTILLEGKNTLRIRLIDSDAPESSRRNAALPLEELNYKTAHLLLVRLLDVLEVKLTDREIYLILYNSRADPEAIRLFESAQALIESSGDMSSVDRAIELFEESIAVDSSFALSYFWVAQAYLLRHEVNANPADLDKAQEANLRANELDPDRVLRFSSYVSQGLLYRVTGKLDEAIAAFEKAIALDSSQSISFIGIAEALALKTDSKATSYFHQALSLDASNTDALIAIGIYKFNREEYDSAAFYFERIIKLDDSYKAAHRNLGASYKELGQIDLAMQSYNDALHIEPDFLSHHNMAVIY